MIYRHVAESINGETYFLNELGFFPNSYCLLCVILSICSKMQHYTLCHGKQIAETFFPLACCLMVLLPVILSLTPAYTNKSSWLMIPFHCHRESGSIVTCPKRGNYHSAFYISLLQVVLAKLHRFMIIILYLYYSNSKRYQQITTRPSEVLFGCVTPGLWLLCSVWRLQMEEVVKHQITLFPTAPLILMLQLLEIQGE